MNDNTPSPAFGPLVETCAAHGISRTVCFELARDGLLETFGIGRRRYVQMQSLRDLPRKLAEREAGSTGTERAA